MAHLRTYKSFNLQEIEEIESRIFGPTVPSENLLKGCPGTTNIPHVVYEVVSGLLFQRKNVQGDASNWEALQDNILKVLQNARYPDPMIVHINQKYIEDDDLETYEESNITGVSVKKSEVTWSKHALHHTAEVNNEECTQPGAQEDATLPKSKLTFAQFFRNIGKFVLEKCLCRKRK